MKRKTYNNVLKAGKLIQKKGYEEKEALELAVQKFDQLKSLNNNMPVEWLIDKMPNKNIEADNMTYTEFLSNIDKYVGYVVEFKTRFKSNGKIFTSQRYVWDNKEFGALKPDSLIEVLSVKVLYKKETKRTESGINY
jgi:hypothetical protein